MSDNKLWESLPPAVRSWLSLERDTVPHLDLSTDIERDLADLIHAGAIKVEQDSSKYFTAIEDHYPIAVNRIEWRLVRNHVAYDVLPAQHSGLSAYEHEQRLLRCKPLIQNWFQVYGVDHCHSLVVLGDTCDIALRMQADTFLEYYWRLFTSGQQVYVLPTSSEWCLNYTLEGQLFMGRADEAKETGSVVADE